jgi:hypothetical protein
VAGEQVAAFFPRALPPRDPPLVLDGAVASRLRAEQALIRLELAGEMVPSLDWFIYAFVRKEAVFVADRRSPGDSGRPADVRSSGRR